MLVVGLTATPARGPPAGIAVAVLVAPLITSKVLMVLSAT